MVNHTSASQAFFFGVAMRSRWLSLWPILLLCYKGHKKHTQFSYIFIIFSMIFPTPFLQGVSKPCRCCNGLEPSLTINTPGGAVNECRSQSCRLMLLQQRKVTWDALSAKSESKEGSIFRDMIRIHVFLLFFRFLCEGHLNWAHMVCKCLYWFEWVDVK